MPKQQRNSMLVEAERQERRVHGPFRSAYRHLLGALPRCRPGDTIAASGYLERIERAIEHGGWTPAESDRLYRMRKIWRARASGQDARFNRYGNRPGPPLEQARGARETTAGDRGALKGLKQLLAAEEQKIHDRVRRRQRATGEAIGERRRGE